MLPRVPQEALGFGEVDDVVAIEEICRLLPSSKRRGTPVMLLCIVFGFKCNTNEAWHIKALFIFYVVRVAAREKDIKLQIKIHLF